MPFFECNARHGENLFNLLEETRLALGATHESWATTLQLSLDDYAVLYLDGHCQKLPFISLYAVGARMNVSIKTLCTEPLRVDPKALAAHYSGALQYLPERYTVGAFSRRRTMKNILDDIECSFGFNTRFSLLRKLQVTESTFRHRDDESINLTFATDLMEELSRRNVSPTFFRRLGINSVRKTTCLSFAKELAESRSIKELYESYLEDKVKQIEKNAEYRISSVGDSFFIVEAKQSDEVVDALKNRLYGSSNICEFRGGVIGSIPLYVGQEPVNAAKIACVHKGDPSCRWLVQFRPLSLGTRLSAVQ